MTYSDILRIKEEDLPEIIKVWEASVRATHHFLKEEDILFFKPKVAEYLLETNTFYIKNETNNQIAGFIGISEKNIDMLFIHPSERGKGLGKRLLHFAFDYYYADKVDVNEQNEQALLFYKKIGFKIIGRDETDGTGKPYPILHMQLETNKQ